MLPRPRLFVKKRGTRRTGARWSGYVAEGLVCAAFMIAGAFGLYWLIDRVVTAEGAGRWPWFAMVIPIALFGYGAAGLGALIWQTVASAERRAAAVRKATGWEIPGIDSKPDHPALPSVPSIHAVTDSPGVRLAYRLPIDAASGWVSFTMAVVCLAWNTFVILFVVQVIQLHRTGHPNWLITWLMVPFVLAGIWTLVELGRQVLVNIAIGTTRVEVSHHPFHPSGKYRGFVSQTGRLHVRWFQVQLVCEEQAIHQQGTDTRRAITRVYQQTLFSQRKFDVRPHEAFAAEFDVPVPESAMHSFVSQHNAVTWALIIRGRIARWGDFERRFPLYVYPRGATKQLDPERELASAQL